MTARHSRAQLTVTEDPGAQTTVSLQENLGAGCECAIHPVTRRALLRPIKTNALNFKFLVDEPVEIDATCNHVAPRRSRRAIVYAQRNAKLIENVEREKRDLAFVIVFKIEVAIAANPASCEAFHHGHFDHGIRVRLATVMADEIVSRRNVQVTDFHRLQQYLKSS